MILPSSHTFYCHFEIDSGEHIPLRNMHCEGKTNESKHQKFIHLSYLQAPPSIRTFFSGHSLRTRACISVVRGPRDEISSSGDRMERTGHQQTTTTTEWPAVNWVYCGQRRNHHLKRENWIPCWSLGFKDERSFLTECPWAECLDVCPFSNKKSILNIHDGLLLWGKI
ncbi:hypothetical protein CEXT_475141 [Caerostris extrusa]|uniref:Uncharacterized protein n=1 Tax=Caerostris extrusa TaxID=172846 RepID=A0AAV4MN58_CAEEX|nr:hypothetical protein CEXT_475141 [Caerostris extrusa]